MKLKEYLDTVLIDTPDDTDYVFCHQRKPIDGEVPWPPCGEEAVLRGARSSKPGSFYLSTMVARVNEQGEYRNKKSQFYGLHALVLDDVGSKVDPNALTPTAKIESSPGNYQWVYFLKEILTDEALVHQLVHAVYSDGGLTDPGGKLINKFMRLPAGVNNKVLDDGTVNSFEVALVELNDEVFYTVDELVKGFGITLTPVGGVGEVYQPDTGGMPPVDSVLEWMRRRGMVQDETPDAGGFIKIQCPWHAGHTAPGDWAGYNPLGAGGQPDTRGFHCFHGHCNERKTHDFLEFVSDAGGPDAGVWDPVAPMVARYVLLEHSNEVADTAASAAQPYPIVSLASFKNARRQFIRGDRGAKQYYGDLWLEHDDTVRCRGRLYEPEGATLHDIDGVVHFNTYRAPSHAVVGGEPLVYLEHIEWLIPDEAERELFHSWVAQKLQKPSCRSYAMVLVSDLAEGEEGERYGTGRSTVGDILGRVFQSGVSKLELSDITGHGDSQSAYNDWADGTLLAVVEETKEEAADWRMDHAAYERVKKVIDTRPIPGVRVKPKYGKIYETTLYANFLFFTNHSDALQLPPDDRRFCVLDNAKGRRSYEEYGALQEFLRNDRQIAQLYWWYMGRDISEYEHVYPPMTPAKERMISQAKHGLDEIWEMALAQIEKPMVTQKHLIDVCTALAEGDEGLEIQIPKMVRARWRKLGEVTSGWKLTVGSKWVRPRIVKDHKMVRSSHQNGDFDALRGMIAGI